MISPTSQRTKHAEYQIPPHKKSIIQKTSLTLLSPELLMKIISHARGSLVNFRLSCKQIDKTLAEASVRAFFDSRTLQLQTNNFTAPFAFPNLEKFSRLEEIAVELSGQAKEREWEERLPHFREKVEIDGYFPSYSKLKKIRFDQNIQPSNNLVFQLIINSWPRENTHLTTVDLQDCSKVSNEAFVNMFKSLLQLRKIKLGRSNLIDPRDCHFKMAELKSLMLTKSPHATDLFLERILKVAPQLEELEISYCDQMTGQPFEQISNNLRSLKISLNDPKYHEKAMLKLDSRSLMNLLERNDELIKIDLDLPKGSLAVNSSENISFKLQHANLRQLAFGYIDASELILHLPRLEELVIKNFLEAADENLKVIDGLPNLKKLDIEYGYDLSISTLISLTSKSSQLEEITLKDCPRITSPFWDQVNFQNLTSFHLSDGDPSIIFTPKDFGNLVRSAPNLRDIFLECMAEMNLSIEDASFGNLEGTLQSLRYFYCIAFPSVKNSEILKVINQAKKLEQVNISYMEEITYICVLQLVHNCQNLKTIKFEGCQKISDEMVDALDEFVKLKKSRQSQSID